MFDEIKNKLDEIKNPVTSKTFRDEKRWRDIQLNDRHLTLVYDREGISPVEKRSIEQEIQRSLEKFGLEEILVKTISSNSQDVYSSTACQSGQKVEDTSSQKHAQIKAGHGTVGNKKNVPGVGKVIAIGSGKGGVGKSTFTGNLAITLSSMGYKVGVIDADIYGPSLPMIFGTRSERPRSNEEKKILPVEAHGVKMLSFGFFINENDPVIWRGPMLGGVINQFLFDADWNGIDYLLIDLPPGTGDIQLSMVQNAHVDGAIIISTPQDIALLDAKKGLEMFKKLNLPIIGMVENMSSFICNSCGTEHFIFGKDGVVQAVEEMGVNFLGKVPLELELRTGSDAGRPYMADRQFCDRPVWTAFVNIGEQVTGYFSPEKKSKSPGIFSKLFGLEK